MEEFLTRTTLLLGEEGIEKLKQSRVVVMGLGGVGSAATEGLVRCGVGHLLLVDGDTVNPTNLNRQLIATTETIGWDKTEATAKRLRLINPKVELTLAKAFVLPENSDFIWDFRPDFIIDAIDTVTTKLFLAEEAYKRGVPMISSMGTGGRLNPTMIRQGDIADTKGTFCSLARVIRRELKKRGVPKLTVVYSLEEPCKLTVGEENGRHPPTSSSFVPPCAGYALGSYVVRSLLGRLS